MKNYLGIFGIYKKKAIFFVGLFAIFLMAFNFTKYSADSVVSGSQTTNDLTNISIDVQKNGSVIINGKKNKYAVNFLKNYDEIRFPVIDNPGSYIGSAVISLKLPANVAQTTNHEILAIHGVSAANSYVSDSNTLIYQADGIGPTSTVSIIAQIPKGVLTQSIGSKIYGALSSLKANYWLVIASILPIITLLFMFRVLGRQYRSQHIEVPKIESDSLPMAVPPAIIGALYRQKIGSREIAATLIDLAQRGDLVIIDRDRGFAFGKGKFDRRLLGFEKILLSKIFKNKLSATMPELEKRINDHFYSKKISIVTSGMYALATRLGYFKVNPHKVHVKYRLFGIFAFLIGLGCFILSLFMFTDPPYVVFFWIGMMLASLIIAFAAGNLPIRTEIGHEVLSNWLGFRKFLCNPDPFPFSEDNQRTFQKYLPYAIVLDCEAAWARRFAEHNFVMPDWYITDKNGLGIEDFCLSLFPLISYVGRSLAAIREPGFE